MKRIFTHPRPHIDDICGIWLIQKFLSGWEDASIEFASAMAAPSDDADTIMIGIGRGKFDEHKGDIGESAASLVWKYLKSDVLKDKGDMDEVQISAVDRLVEWVRRVDTSEHEVGVMTEYGSWLPPAQLRRYYNKNNKDSGELYTFGAQLCDLALLSYQNDVRLNRDWENRVEFDSSLGKGVALETDASGADDFAYNAGFDLLAILHPGNNHRGYRARAGSDVDLTKTYEELQKIDPNSDWFLHHSKKLLLCGSAVAPESKLSEFSLQDLIKAIR